MINQSGDNPEIQTLRWGRTPSGGCWLSRLAMAAALVLMISLLSGCAALDELAPLPTPTASAMEELHGIFRPIYKGQSQFVDLGKVINAPVERGGVIMQCTEKLMFVYDQNQDLSHANRPAPLGVDMGISEPPVLKPADPTLLYIDGHVVDPVFRRLYDSLGEWFVGPPLTEKHYDQDRKRYYQYFANLGFYHYENSSEAFLMDYGLWACNMPGGMMFGLSPTLGSDTALRPVELDKTFEAAVNWLGADFTGLSITPGCWNADGKWEVVLQNMIMVSNQPGDMNSVQIAPLTEAINTPIEPPRPFSGDIKNYFVPVSGGLGYEIPFYFWEYLQPRGGLAISGQPITHASVLNNRMVHMCFTNLCLTFDPHGSPTAPIRPEMLGPTYLTMNPNHCVSDNRPEPVVDIETWHRLANISPEESQAIGCLIHMNGEPAEGLLPQLFLDMPDGSVQQIDFPPTDVNGLALVQLAPIPAPPGTMIIHSICVRPPNASTSCVKDSYIIWVK